MKKLLVLAAAAMLLVAFTVPASATEWSFYGRVYLKTHIKDTDNPAPSFDDKDTIWARSTSSRFGINYKITDALSGTIEMRADDTSDHSRNVTFRKWFIDWKVGPGTLTVGHTWAPTFSPSDESFIGGGTGNTTGTYDKDLLQYKFPVGPATVKIAGVEVNRTSVDGSPAATEFDNSLPKLESAADFKVGPVSLKFMLGYQSYEEVDTTTDVGYDVDSLWLGAKASWSSGPFYVIANYFKADNPKEYGEGASYKAFWDGHTLHDAEVYGWHVTFQYTISDTMKLNLGYGVEESSIDYPGVSKEDPKNAYYINLPITVAPGFTIAPEYSVEDADEETINGHVSEQASVAQYGVMWKIVF